MPKTTMEHRPFRYSRFIKGTMPETKKQKTYLDSRKRTAKLSNHPTKKSGKLTKDGLVYRNDLMDVDMTSQIPTRRKLKGV